MAPRARAPTQANNHPVGAQAAPGAQIPQGNVAPGQVNNDNQPLDGASVEEWRAYAATLQLRGNDQRRELEEITRERDALVTRQQNKRRRARHVDEPTPEDPKYQKAGKRCALMQLLWVDSDLFETEVDATYTDACRYDKATPKMRVQGNLQDVLASAPLLRENLLQKVHFQSVLINSANEQRRNSAVRARKACGSLIFGFPQKDINDNETRSSSPEFRRLLGYRSTRPVGRRYPTLPPILYSEESTGSNDRIFRHDCLIKLFRACAFGPSSVTTSGVPTDLKGQHVVAKILGLKVITLGAIAFSAILARWCLSPDEEFSEVGKTSGIKYKVDYHYYKKLVIEGVRREKETLARDGEHGPFLRLINEWNKNLFPRQQTAEGEGSGSDDDDPSDVEAAMDEIREYGQASE